MYICIYNSQSIYLKVVKTKKSWQLTNKQNIAKDLFSSRMANVNKRIKKPREDNFKTIENALLFSFWTFGKHCIAFMFKLMIGFSAMNIYSVLIFLSISCCADLLHTNGKCEQDNQKRMCIVWMSPTFDHFHVAANLLYKKKSLCWQNNKMPSRDLNPMIL